MKIAVTIHGYGNSEIRIESSESENVEDCLEEIQNAISGFGRKSIAWTDANFLLLDR